MSAQIVTEFSRDAYDPARLFPNGVGGDVLKRIRPGQLWERVAETPSNAPAPLTARQDAGIVRAYATRDDDRARMTGGHYYAKANVSAKARSGIIRAGVRVR